MRRGQAAFEFLMTYGWAILAVLVMMGALAYYAGYFPLVSPSKCVLDTPFACVSYKVDAPASAGQNGTIELGIVPMKGMDYVNVTVDCNRGGLYTPSNITTGYIQDTLRLNGSMLRFSCPVSGTLHRGNIYIRYRLYNQVVFHDIKGSFVAPVENN
jgi:hypothetical protein